MAYDGFGRQRRWTFPSKTTPGVADPGDYEQYLYDEDGNRTSLRKRDGSILAFHYDALNRMTAKIVPERSGLSAAQTRDVHYAYDLRGLQTQARFDSPSGEGVTTQYDGLGRFKALRENGADPLVAFAYNAAGQRSGLTSGGTTSAYAYDSAGRLQSLNHNLAGTSADQVIGLGYNPAGQIASRTGTNDAYAWPGSVAVDRPYSVNGQNQYTAAGSSTFTYDANGNLTSDGSSTFVYDVENRLVSASGAKNAALAYDPLGRLFETSGYASYGGKVTAVEISQGRAQLRPVNHNRTTGFRSRANDHQSRRARERR